MFSLQGFHASWKVLKVLGSDLQKNLRKIPKFSPMCHFLDPHVATSVFNQCRVCDLFHAENI